MKKIYTFTLDSEDYPSEKFRYNLRIIACLLYDSIYNYYGDKVIPVNINKNIRINNFREIDRKFVFDSDNYDDGYINYEPFFIGNSSFAFTVNDDKITDEIMMQLAECTAKMVDARSSIVVNSETYYSKGQNDESHRMEAIKSLYERIGYRFDRKVNLVKRLINRDRYRTSKNCYAR